MEKEKEKSLGVNYSATTADSEPKRALGFFEILRVVKLQIVDPVFGWNLPSERRKVAIHHSHRIAAVHALLHIPPLVAALTLIALNWKNYYIGPGFIHSTTLQFVAKFHEILIQVSISGILLHIIRAQMTQEHIPLGGLSAALQNHQLSYLWSLEFVSIIRLKSSARIKVIFLLVTPVLILLMAVVGPSSAALMIPRPNMSTTVRSLVYYGNSYETLTPTVVDGSFNFAMNSSLFSLGRQLDQTWKDDSLKLHQLADTILDMDGIDRLQRRVLRYKNSHRSEKEQGTKAIYYSATATLPTRTSMVNLYWLNEAKPIKDSNLTLSVKLPNPVVVSRCTMSLTGLSRDFSLPYIRDDGTTKGSLPPLGSLLDAHFVPSRNKVIDFDVMPLIWMSSPEVGSSSLIGIFASSDIPIDWNDNCTIDEMLNKNCPTLEEWFTMKTCTISAYWSTSEQEFLFNEGAQVVRTNQELEAGFGTFRYGAPIKMDVSNISSLSSPFYDGLIVCSTCFLLETVLAYAFAITLAEIPTSSNNDWSSVPNMVGNGYYTPYTFSWKQSGFGYGTSSTAIQLALTVMTIYCSISFVYIVYILITGYTSTAWNSTVEFILLALQSRSPDHLGHISVGINSLKTFEESIGVRVNSSEKLELVFARDRDIYGTDAGSLRKIKPNKKY